MIKHRSSLKGGRTLYVWMRMPEVLGPEATFNSLLHYAGQQLR